MRFLKIGTLVISISVATPALADDWTLSCSYPQDGLELLAHYNAGDPSYSLTVVERGTTELPVGLKQDAEIIMSREEVILFTHFCGGLIVRR